MTNSLADRIKSRLDALGKSAATASIEAGLGRSAVQNILRGASESPRLSTLQKLSVSLECSLDYLIGASDDLGEAADSRAITAIYADPGVFRFQDKWAEIIDEAHFFSREKRLPDWNITPYITSEDIYIDWGIASGDYIAVASPPDENQNIPLSSGSLVMVRYTVGQRPVHELSVRYVSVKNQRIELRYADEKDGPPILIALDAASTERSAPMANSYKVGEGELVTIEGIVVRVIRHIPIPHVEDV